MKIIEPTELKRILTEHAAWLTDKDNGTKASLPDTDLRGANLSYTDLSYTSLSDADLRGTNLSYTNLSYASLPDADVRGADLSYADLSYADLRGVDLNGADLSYASLSYTNLSGASLSGANLSVADLRGADVSYADLSGADLSGASLPEANFRGADLRGADLSCTKGIVCLPISDPRGHRPVAVIRCGEWVIAAGCRWLAVPQAREHWGQSYIGDRAIGDQYLAGLEWLEKQEAQK